MQGVGLRKDASRSPQGVHSHGVAPHDAHDECAAGVHARRPSSAGGVLEAPGIFRRHDAAAPQRGFMCDPFKALQAGPSKVQQHAQPCSSDTGRAGGPWEQGSVCPDERKVQSCDFPVAGGPPVDPLMPDSCSTDFASVAARRPAFQAAFYFGARRRSDPDLEPFDFGEHGPLAAGAQRFSTSLPDAHLLEDSPAAAARPSQSDSTPDQPAQRPRVCGPFAETVQQAGLGDSGEACGAATAMEVCSSGRPEKGTPQTRHGQLLWPASLTRLRRGDKRSPQSPPVAAGCADPDMQPLGRHISGVHSADGCDTPDAAACRPSQPGSGKEKPTRAFSGDVENVPGLANCSAMHMATEGTPYAEDGGRARGRGSALAMQQPRGIERSPLMEVTRAGHASPGNAWQVGCA